MNLLKVVWDTHPLNPHFVVDSLNLVQYRHCCTRTSFGPSAPQIQSLIHPPTGEPQGTSTSVRQACLWGRFEVSANGGVAAPGKAYFHPTGRVCDGEFGAVLHGNRHWEHGGSSGEWPSGVVVCIFVGRCFAFPLMCLSLVVSSVSIFFMVRANFGSFVMVMLSLFWGVERCVSAVFLCLFLLSLKASFFYFLCEVRVFVVVVSLGVRRCQLQRLGGIYRLYLYSTMRKWPCLEHLVLIKIKIYIYFYWNRV